VVLVTAAVCGWQWRVVAPGVAPSPAGRVPAPPPAASGTAGLPPEPGGVLMAGVARLVPGSTMGSASNPGVTLTLGGLAAAGPGRVRLALVFRNGSEQAAELVLDYAWTVLRDAEGGACRMTADAARTPAGGEFRALLPAGDRRAYWIECMPSNPDARLFVFSPGPVSEASNRVRFEEFEVLLEDRAPVR